MRYILLWILGFALVSLSLTAQKVGINTDTPVFDLDIRGTDDTSDGGELQIATPSQTNFLRFFSGRLGDHHPFMAFNDNDTFHIVTTLPDWSTYTRRMTWLPSGQVGIGTVPDASAVLDISSTNKGILIPRTTTEQRMNIGSPATGLMVFDTDVNKFYCYAGSEWVEILSGYVTLMHDADNDTKIQVEEGEDENKIRFDLAGEERWVMQEGRLEPRNTGGSVYIGEGAGASDDLTDNYNSAIGDSALYSNTTGAFNTAHGRYALYSNKTSNENTANGYAALFSNTTGQYNTASGSGALYFNTTGTENTASGNVSLLLNTTGSHNTAIGYRALINNLTGHSNIAVGVAALYNNTERSNQVAVGDSALYNNGIGATESFHSQYNTAIGSKTLYANTLGSYNTATGNHALYLNTTGSYNTASGDKALYSNTSGSSNTAIGSQVLFSNLTGYANMASGELAMRSNTSGHHNTASGTQAMFFNTIGFQNTAVGCAAMNFNVEGNDNTASGYEALYSNIYGSENTASGYQALYSNTDGSSNTAFGSKALYSNTSGVLNAASGKEALYSNTSGILNTAFGFQALHANEEGYSRTGIGYGANSTLTGAINNTGLGAGTLCTSSDQVRIGNSSVGSIGGQVVWTALSDARFKRNIREDVRGLEFISKLRPVTYTLDQHALEDFFEEHYGVRDTFYWPTKYDASQIVRTGFIAQEVETAAASIGYDFDGVDKPKNEDDYYGLRYGVFVVPLVKAIQELVEWDTKRDKQLDELQAMIEALQERNAKLEFQINTLMPVMEKASSSMNKE